MYPSIVDQIQALNTEERAVYDRLRFSESIEGWLLLKEAIELYNLVYTTKRRPAIFCEIGTWMGKSISILGRAALDRGDAIVYGVDPFNGIGDAISEREYQSRRKKLKLSQIEECLSNLDRVGVGSVIHLLQLTSAAAINTFPEMHIDGLFIDGDHTYEHVMEDVALWSPLLESGGWLVLHDVGAVHVDGPKRVMKELQRETRWVNWYMVGEMAVCRRR
jgi:predicted O-methyltransferase YrrM